MPLPAVYFSGRCSKRRGVKNEAWISCLTNWMLVLPFINSGKDRVDLPVEP